MTSPPIPLSLTAYAIGYTDGCAGRSPFCFQKSPSKPPALRWGHESAKLLPEWPVTKRREYLKGYRRGVTEALLRGKCKEVKKA